MKKHTKGLPGLLALLLAGCGDGTTSEETRRTWTPYLQTIFTENIPRAASDFRSSMDGLEQAVDNLCAAPSDALLEQAQQAYRQAHVAWGGLVPHYWGPLNDDPIIPRMYFIESMRQRGIVYIERVRTALDQVPSPPTEASVSALPFTNVGLLSVEVMLFEDSAEATDSASIVAGLLAEPDRCTFTQLVTEQVQSRAIEIDDAWSSDAGSIDSESFARRTVIELMITWYEHFEYTKQRKLDATLDATLSGTFYDHQIRTFDRMEAIVFAGETPLVNPGSTEAEQRFAAARDAATNQDRAALTTAVQGLIRLFRDDIPADARLNLGVNFVDGD